MSPRIAAAFRACVVDWLRVVHDRSEVPIPDDAGVHYELIAYFDDLSRLGQPP